MRLLLICTAILFTSGVILAEPPKADDAAKIKKAKADLQTLTNVCKSYKLRFVEFPEELEQLLKPPAGKPFLESKESLLDPWGQKYHYSANGDRNNGFRPDIWTVTPAKTIVGNWPDDDPKVNKAKADMGTLTQACQAYRLKFFDYPEKLEQLLKPPEGQPFIESEKLFIDPWGKKYEYDQKSRRSGRVEPDIWTVGPDKKEIRNWVPKTGK